MLIAAILMIVFVGVFTYFFLVNDHGGNFAFFGPAVVAGMLFPVALSIAVNSSRFNNYGNLILMLVLSYLSSVDFCFTTRLVRS